MQKHGPVHGLRKRFGAALVLGFVALLPHAEAGEVWKPAGRGFSGHPQIAGMGTDPRNPARVFVLTAFDGFYTSFDRGRSWHATSDGLPTRGVVLWAHLFGNQLTQDPNDPSTLFIVQNGVVYKSEDSGGSWRALPMQKSECGTESLAGTVVDPHDSRRVLAGSVISNCEEPTFFESINGGEAWSPIAAEGIGNDSWMLAFDPFVSGRVYLSTIYRGFHFSPNGGRTFTENTPPGALPSQISLVRPHPQNPGRIFVGGRTGLFSSPDHGVSWTKKLVADSVSDVTFGLSQPDVGYAIGDALYGTSDGGLSWTKISPQSGQVVVSNPEDNGMLHIGSAAGLFAATVRNERVLVERTEKGLPQNIQIRALKSVKSWSYATAPTAGFFRQRGNRSWRLISSDYPEVSQSLFIAATRRRPKVIYAGFQKLYLSRSGGKDFQEIDLSINQQSEVFNTGVVHPRDSKLVMVGTSSGRLFRSTDGLHFRAVPSLRARRQISQIVFDPRDPFRVYAVTYDDLWVSDDAGETWERLTSAEGAHAYMDSLVISPRDSQKLYVSTRGQRIFTSLDRGVTWREAFDTAPESRVVLRADRRGVVLAFGSRTWWKQDKRSGIWSIGSRVGLADSDSFAPWTVQVRQRSRQVSEIRGAVNARGLYQLRTR